MGGGGEGGAVPREGGRQATMSQKSCIQRFCMVNLVGH
jgi:hypothetical protein